MGPFDQMKLSCWLSSLPSTRRPPRPSRRLRLTWSSTRASCIPDRGLKRITIVPLPRILRPKVSQLVFCQGYRPGGLPTQISCRPCANGHALSLWQQRIVAARRSTRGAFRSTCVAADFLGARARANHSDVRPCDARTFRTLALLGASFTTPPPSADETAGRWATHHLSSPRPSSASRRSSQEFFDLRRAIAVSHLEIISRRLDAIHTSPILRQAA